MRKLLAVLAVVALFTAPVFAQSADELYNEAKKFYDVKEYGKAAPMMLKSAEMGNAEAQMHMGKMYFNGWGVPHSHEIARQWHEKAAAQGNQESIEKLKNFRHSPSGH